MTAANAETLPIASEHDIVIVRQAVRRHAQALGFSLVDQTKVVTATSELARNALVYGGGGRMVAEVVEDGGRRGLKLTFADDGPGIADVEQAMKDGFTSGGGLGMGLGGAKRLVNEFRLDSRPGAGTRVTITKWRYG